MAKQKKQTISNDDFSIDLSNVSKATEKLNVDKGITPIATKGIYLPLQVNTYNKFNDYFNKFIKETESYKFPKKNMFLSACVDYLHRSQKATIAPDAFVKHITRRGKRVKSDRSYSKEETEILSLKIDEQCYLKYIDLMHNFLLKENNLYNLYYSIPYFFYDFMDMIAVNFEDIVLYYKNK